jgi:16S rRNA (guanine527-N7)-methyltransferase
VDALPALDDEFWSVVNAGLADIELELSDPARSAIDAQVRLLRAWNAAINLTALRTLEQIARGHVLDSLLAIPKLRSLAGDGSSLIDIGSGGGFPGLPLALALPAGRAALVDSIGKKAAFLEVAALAAARAASAAGGAPPDLVALAERAEDLADEADHRETWDVVVFRAVGSVAESAELGLPLTRRGGSVVIWKRNPGDGSLSDEVEAAVPIARACGGRGPLIVELPAAAHLGLEGHCLVIVEKQRSTPARYPRPVGERRRSAIP